MKYMLHHYQYLLPPHLLATEPSSPRDASKLMVYDTATDSITIDRFYRIVKYLPKNSFLVLNQTIVAPARVTLHRENGGSVTVLFLMNEPRGNGVIRGMVDRKLLLGEKIFVDHDHEFQVIAQDVNIFTFQMYFSEAELPQLLSRYGTMPIPPYLKASKLSEQERRRKYQTTFSLSSPLCHSELIRLAPLAQGRLDPRNPFLSSIAAPTASLHFTNRVFKSLDKKGIPHFFITLHVGRGTFAPVTEEQLQARRLHNEWYSVDPKTVEAIRQLKEQGKKLVAVGTTTVRTMESYPVIPSDPPEAGSRGISLLNSTDLFITPPYDFKAVDILITNFHLPRSSLMMLVEAFLQYKKAPRHLVDLYLLAIEKNFRFYSFGDSMMIL